MKVKARAMMFVMGVFAYLFLSITCYQNAYAEEYDTFDYMIAHSRCIAALEITRWKMEAEGKTGLEQVFAEYRDKYIAAWPWSDEEHDNFVQAAYEELRGISKEQGNFDTVVGVATICMEAIQ